MLPPSEQVPGELYEHGNRIRCVVIHVTRGFRGPQITLSRSDPHLVQRLFELEVPEIADGTVQITKIAREAGPPIQDRRTVDGLRRQRQGCVYRPHGAARTGRDERIER